jgi:hypothetical protein
MPFEGVRRCRDRGQASRNLSLFSATRCSNIGAVVAEFVENIQVLALNLLSERILT